MWELDRSAYDVGGRLNEAPVDVGAVTSDREAWIAGHRGNGGGCGHSPLMQPEAGGR
ncbi:hypothetical protein GCM10009753_70590 [Streptantibioticus ferralitis]